MRSGKQTIDPPRPDPDPSSSSPSHLGCTPHSREDNTLKLVPKSVPFPEALLKEPKGKKKNMQTFDNLHDLFKDVEIKVPLLEPIDHILTVGRFLKDYTTPRQQQKKTKNPVVLSPHASCAILSKLPPKQKVPGTPSISCTIKGCNFDHSLRDLRSSICNFLLGGGEISVT
jgi:hypothetical protein